MSMISLSNLTFSYPGGYQPVFENCSVTFDTDWRLGLTGRNGRGKTTLLRLLLGSQKKEYGLCDYLGSIVSKTEFVYFPMPVKHPDYLAMEVMQELCPGCEDWKIRRELELLGIREDALWRSFETLSGGEKTKMQLAALFLREGAFALIDEPTNHLDVQGRETVANYLKKQSGFLLVSHDRDFLDQCVDHIISLNRSDIEVRKGDFSGWYQDYLTRTQSETQQNEKLKKEIRRLESAARRTAQWSDKVEATKIGQGPCDRGAIGHKAAKMMKRSKAIEKRQLDTAQQKKELLKNVENVGGLKIQTKQHFSGKLAECYQLSICYDNKEIFEPLTFSLEQGKKVCLQGRNGSGKTSLLRLIYGEKMEYSGVFRIASGVKISYVSQDTSGLYGNLQEYLEEQGADITKCLSILRNLGFERSQFEIPTEQYSMGQKKKVLIAKSLSQQAHLYLWDEPLNYIDIFSRIQIEQLLKQSQAAMLFVEHDRRFCDNVADSVIWVEPKQR